ncbi:hypothetical protein AQUCO_02500165v1 [Aquilegia coerulea]|uniref:Uncharacterized protein n=1 Tax=Aquilegia coerulea TaxID=218851 RepID=A0A2G5D9Y2_AQUCA|nr:hypothetical protein AQUCO_02500165v1 [Aquilegia coerulea]
MDLSPSRNILQAQRFTNYPPKLIGSTWVHNVFPRVTDYVPIVGTSWSKEFILDLQRMAKEHFHTFEKNNQKKDLHAGMVLAKDNLIKSSSMIN